MRYGAQAWHKRAALGGGSVPAEVSDTPGTFRTQTSKLGAQSVAAPSRMISLPPAAHTHRRCLACAEPIRSVVYSSVHLLSRKLSCVTGSHHSALHANRMRIVPRERTLRSVCVARRAMPCHAMPHGAASVGSVFEASSPLGARQRPTSEHHHAAQVWYHAASAL